MSAGPETPRPPRSDDGGDIVYPTSIAPNERTPLVSSPDGAGPQNTLPGGSVPVIAASDAADQSVSWRRAICIIMSMWALIFLQASNMSGMAMIQSIIAVDLGAYEDAMWFTSAYLIAAASVSPLVGRLSMIFSPGSMILAASIVFAAGALATSQARTFPVFLSGRVLLGVGAGGILTLSLILILQLTSLKRRGLFVGLANAGFTIGLSTGAVVFGALVPAIGWRALFGAQVPIGLVAGLGVYLGMPRFAFQGPPGDKTTTLQKLGAVDYAGAVALTLSIVLFLYGLSGAVQPLPIIFSFVAFLGFLTVEYFVASDPIIPISIFRSRGILFSCLAQLFFMAARWTVLFFAPVFVLAVRGLSPAIAGAVLIPTNAGFGSAGLLVGWLHVRRPGSFWLPSLASYLCFGATLYSLSILSTAASPTWLYVLALFLNGFATGTALSYTLAHLLHLSAAEAHFIATSLLGTFRGFAGSFGTAIGGGIFSRTLRAALTKGFRALDHDGGSGSGGGSGEVDGDGRRDLIARLIGSPALVFGGRLSDAERTVAVQSYEHALGVLYRAATLLCIIVLVIQAAAGWQAPLAKEEEEEDE